MSPEAIIIGSGPGGATAAEVLTRAGWSVVIMEKGRNHLLDPNDLTKLASDFSNDEIKFVRRHFLGPDPFFDDLFLGAARQRFVTAERVVTNGELEKEVPLPSVGIHRMLTDGVCESPGGAHFTACPPDYERDEAFQKEYAASTDPEKWTGFKARYLDVSEDDYHRAVVERSEQGS